MGGLLTLGGGEQGEKGTVEEGYSGDREMNYSVLGSINR